MSYPATTYTPSAPSMPFAPKTPVPVQAHVRRPTPVAARPTAYATQAARYRDAELGTATPGQLVVMLYDKMLLTLRRARIAFDAKQIEVRCEQILKAGEMIAELRASLDHQQGGAIAKQLEALYSFMLRELLAANRTQDARKIDGVIRMASELRDAFAQVVAGGAGGAGGAGATRAARGA